MRTSYDSLYAFSKLPIVNPMISVTRWVMRGPLIFLLRLFLVRVTYFRMGTITNKNCDFQKEPKFISAFKAAQKQQDIPDVDIWRYHVNHWAVRQALKLEGDFVECGVYRGSTAMSNIVYFGSTLKDRKYYLFDTFNGLDKNVSTKEEYRREAGKYPECYQFVSDSFKKYHNVRLVRGTIPNSLSQVKIDKVAYLSIDMNCAWPEEKAMEYFWPKMVKGGVIVLDDYGWPMCERQKEAADRFAFSVGTRVLSLPNGQGLIVK